MFILNDIVFFDKIIFNYVIKMLCKLIFYNSFNYPHEQMKTINYRHWINKVIKYLQIKYIKE